MSPSFRPHSAGSTACAFVCDMPVQRGALITVGIPSRLLHERYAVPRSQPTIGGTGLTFNRPSAALLTLLVRLVGHVRLAIADIQVTINLASLFASFKANTAAIGLCTVLND